MHMSAEEVKQFWREFCERHRISDEVIAKGEAKIEADPEYWADQTMGRLRDVIAEGGGRRRQPDPED